MAMAKLEHVIGLAFAAMVFSGSAEAQIGRSDAPVEIKGDNPQLFQAQGQAVYTGNVSAIQDNSRITTDKMTAICVREAPPAGQSINDQPCVEIREMIAEGNVLYTAPDVKIRGDRAQYDYTNDTVVI